MESREEFMKSLTELLSRYNCLEYLIDSEEMKRNVRAVYRKCKALSVEENSMIYKYTNAIKYVGKCGEVLLRNAIKILSDMYKLETGKELRYTIEILGVEEAVNKGWSFNDSQHNIKRAEIKFKLDLNNGSKQIKFESSYEVNYVIDIDTGTMDVYSADMLIDTVTLIWKIHSELLIAKSEIAHAVIDFIYDSDCSFNAKNAFSCGYTISRILLVDNSICGEKSDVHSWVCSLKDLIE